MVENSQHQKPSQDDSELHFAVAALRANPHLRKLVRHFLSVCRVLPPTSVFDRDPVQNAYNQGYQAAGLELAAIITAVDPALIPALLLEELDPNDEE